ncbi:MAG: hypothetical protein R3246_16945, partial [Acidimicrobiia bacterium]|nr:hypothetical protein [Acidimicrobiia bacterium]
ALSGEVITPGFSKVFAPDVIGPGSATRLVFTIDNGDIGTTVDSLAFTDTLPAGVSVADPADVDNSCGGTVDAAVGGSTISLANGRLGAFQSCTISVYVTSATPGEHLNVSGDLTSSRGNSGSASDTLTVTESIPGFTKSFSPDTIPLGATSTLTIMIDNTSSGTPFSFEFDDLLPTGMHVAQVPNATTDCSGSLTAGPGTRQVQLFLGQVPAFDVCSVSVSVTTTDRGIFTNAVEITSDSGSVGYGVAELDVPTTFLEKVFIDDPAAPGGTATLQFTITNLDRDQTATDIAFSDDLDVTLAGLTATLPPDPDPPCGAGSSLTGSSLLSFTGGTLAPQASCTFTVTLNVPADAETGD